NRSRSVLPGKAQNEDRDTILAPASLRGTIAAIPDTLAKSARLPAAPAERRAPPARRSHACHGAAAAAGRVLEPLLEGVDAHRHQGAAPPAARCGAGRTLGAAPPARFGRSLHAALWAHSGPLAVRTHSPKPTHSLPPGPRPPARPRPAARRDARRPGGRRRRRARLAARRQAAGAGGVCGALGPLPAQRGAAQGGRPPGGGRREGGRRHHLCARGAAGRGLEDRGRHGERRRHRQR
ncbi:MAG: hypothetical protein J3K34DRAFT_520814, partial [Monoraphidium minutum]